MYPLIQNGNTDAVSLSIAAEKGHVHTVERLVKGGAKINYQDKVRGVILYKGVLYYILVLMLLVYRPETQRCAVPKG